MKNVLLVVLCIASMCLARVTAVSSELMPKEGAVTGEIQKVLPMKDGVFIVGVGDSYSALGSAGKNIAVSPDGNTIAVIYGRPSSPYNSNNPFGGIGIAYSTDRGATWITYGPITGGAVPIRRIYPGIANLDDFADVGGHLLYAWQEGYFGYTVPTNGYVVIENGLPSSPDFSSPVAYDAQDVDPWFPSPAINPDSNVLVNLMARSYSPYGYTFGNGNIYRWASTEGGYSWTDTIPFHEDLEDSLIDAGHFRWGDNGFGMYVYHDADGTHLNRLMYYKETTDYGNTWSSDSLVSPVMDRAWWHEYDFEVCRDLSGNNFPVSVHGDGGADALYNSSWLISPDPNDPGSPGAWNWLVVDMDTIANDSFVYQDTTWEIAVYHANGGYNVAFQPDLNVILIGFHAQYLVYTGPTTVYDGGYFGGIISIDGGRSWRITRPLSGEIVYAGTYAPSIEMAHRLVTNYSGPGSFNIAADSIWSYSTWINATGAGLQGNAYFELGTVLPINTDSWTPGVVEHDNSLTPAMSRLSITPSISRGLCHVLFSVAAASNVRLGIYDVAGRHVQDIFEGSIVEGEKTVTVNTTDMPNGVYVLALMCGSEVITTKFVVAR